MTSRPPSPSARQAIVETLVPDWEKSAARNWKIGGGAWAARLGARRRRSRVRRFKSCSLSLIGEEPLVQELDEAGVDFGVGGLGERDFAAGVIEASGSVPGFGKGYVGGAEIGVDFGCRKKVLETFAGLPHNGEDETEIVVGFDVVGVEAEGGFKFGAGFAGPARPGVDYSETEVGCGEVGVQAYGVLEFLEGCGKLLSILEDSSDLGVGERVLGSETESFTDDGEGLVGLVGCYETVGFGEGGESEVGFSVTVAGFEAEGLAVVEKGFVETTATVEFDAEVVVGDEIVGVGDESLGEEREAVVPDGWHD